VDPDRNINMIEATAVENFSRDEIAVVKEGYEQ